MKVHPYADRFPVMPEAKLEAMSKDISDNGLQHKMTVRKHANEWELLDGRNRLATFIARSIPVISSDGQPMASFFNTVELDDKDVVAFINSLNVHRRHMTDDEIKILVANGMPIADVAEVTGKSEDTIRGKTEDIRRDIKQERDTKIVELSKQGKTQREIAKEVGIGQATVAAVIGNGQNAQNRSEPKQKTKQSKQDTAARNKDIIHLWELGKSAAEITAETRLGDRRVQRIIQDEKLRREGLKVGQLESAPISASAEEKIAAYKRKLDKEFDWTVRQKLAEEIDKMRAVADAAWKEKVGKWEKIWNRRGNVFTKAEFNIILQVVHPDTGANVTQEKRAQAFRLLNERKIKLLDEKDYPVVPLIHDLVAAREARRAEQQAKNKAKKEAKA